MDQKINIYLAHALSHATPTFRANMSALKKGLGLLQDVVILEFAWVPGEGPPKGVNTFRHDMTMVDMAHLMVAILDETSIGLGFEIFRRASIHKPLLCFIREDIYLSKIVPDGLEIFRLDCNIKTLPPPARYKRHADILYAVHEWTAIYRQETARVPRQGILRPLFEPCQVGK